MDRQWFDVREEYGAEEEQRYQNRLQMEDASVYTSPLPGTESMPVGDHGGVDIQEEYDSLLGKFWNELPNDDVLVTYPEGELDAVEITSNDIKTVQPGGFLSGNIVDFYIKYLRDRLCDSKEDPNEDDFHFFNSFFFTQLARNDGASTESEQRKNAFEKVQKWTGEVNIFEKTFVLIPVNQSSHWSLIIICRLSSLASSSDYECPPCIVHLDSVKSKHGNLEGHIRSYIIHAWKERYHDPSVDQLLALSQMKYAEVKVPQQDNHYDCGIYLLHFVELFLAGWLGDLGCVPNQGTLFSALFSALWDASEVSAKRREIRTLILELSLASRRKSRENHKLLLRCFRLKPVLQICETRLDGYEGRIEGPQNNDLKQSNAGVGESECADHQTAGEGAVDNQQHSEIEHENHQTTGEIVLDDQQQREQLACAKPKQVKERSKRYRNWSKDETSVLLDCKKEGGRFCKRKQATADWIAISQEIENKIGTTPSGDQCRLRYDTLLKAYKSSKDFCMRTGKQFSEELCQGELKLATNLTVDWYNAIDEICCRCSSKRLKYPPGVDGDVAAPVSTSWRDSTDGSPRIENVTNKLCAEARQGSQIPTDRTVEWSDCGNAESQTRFFSLQSRQRASEYQTVYGLYIQRA